MAKVNMFDFLKDLNNRDIKSNAGADNCLLQIGTDVVDCNISGSNGTVKIGVPAQAAYKVMQGTVFPLLLLISNKERLRYAADRYPNTDFDKMKKALETIRDAKWTEGETDKEKIEDLKCIAYDCLYEIEHGIDSGYK